MKHTLFLPLILPLCVIACSEPAPMRGASSATQPGANGTSTAPPGASHLPTSSPKAPMNAAPFDLVLRVENGNRLVAVLHNNASQPYSVVADIGIQPVTLTVEGPKGPVKAFDSRMVQKFDRTVYEHTFTTVAAGADEQVQFANIRDDGGTASLKWGPFQFEDLPPGTYKARAELDSQIADYQDSNGGKAKKSDAWLGKVTSNEVTFQVH